MGTVNNAHPAIKGKMLFKAIIGMACVSVLFLTWLLIWGARAPLLASVPWFLPFVNSFNSITFFAIGFLAIGRHAVLRDSSSFWIGMGAVGFSVLQVFRTLSWPGLMPGGGSIIGSTIGLSAWFIQIGITILAIFLLISATASRPKSVIAQGRSLIMASAWIVFLVIGSGIVIKYESYLPSLVDPSGSFSRTLLTWNLVTATLFAGGAVLSTRRHVQTGNFLAGYMAIVQIGFSVAIFATLIGVRRYDLWWYLTRIIPTCASLFAFLGLLYEYVKLSQREMKKSIQIRSTEEELLRGEKRFQALVAASSEVLYRMSPDWKEMRQLDSRGFLANTQKNRNWLQEYIHPVDQPRVTAVINEAIRTKSTFIFEHRVIRADGSLGWTFSRAVPLMDENSEIVEWFGAASDITEQKQIEQALHESTARFQLAADAAKIGVFSRDLQTGANHWSPEFLAIYGYGPNDQLPLRDGIPTAVHPEDLQKVMEDRNSFYKPPFSDFSSEHRIILPDGQVRWVMIRGRNEFDANHQPLRTTGLAMDITDRKQAEEALAKSLAKAEEGERTLNALMEYVPEGITIADAPDVRIRRVSRYGIELTGRTREELADITVDQHVQKWDLYEADGFTMSKNEDLPLTRATKYGEIVKDKEHVLRKPSGTQIPILCNAAPIRDQDGQITGGIIAYRDITDLKKAEQALHHLNVTLEQQVAERTELAEKRAGQLQALAVELIDAEEKERRRISEWLHEDLQQILAGAKMQLQPARTKASHDSLLDNVDLLLEHAIEKSRSLSQDLSPTILHISDLTFILGWLRIKMSEEFGLFTDLVILSEQPFLNEPLKIFIFRAVQELLLNVAKHSGEKSARVVLSSSENSIVAAVSDKGIGFDPAIFNMSTAVGKSGLGLLSLRERANYIGGRLDIESVPGQGSRITLTVPHISQLGKGSQTVEVEDKIRVEIAEPFTNSDSEIKVLFVDPHKVMRQALIKLVSGKPNIQIVGEAANGQDALELAQQIKPNLVLMDLSMSEIECIKAIRLIKIKLPHVRMIGLLMYEDEAMARTMSQAGADCVISKTASPSELLKAIYGCGNRNV
jgi:PAS domain S-box-containing protein